MFTPESYTIASELFVRLLGFIYFFAFGAFLFQIKGLLGTHGILPVSTFLYWVKRSYPRRCYTLVPTLFWLNSSNAMLMAVVAAGTLLSVLLMGGIFPPLMLFLLYFLYLSVVSAGQDFLSFGWEGFLLEITVNAFLLSLSTPPNPMVWISINLVLFRFHFQGGAVKLQSGDPNWRNLTAVAYHYQSQPIPNTVAWYAHKLPMWFQKLSTLMMFIIELIIPFAIFGTDEMRLVAFFAFVGLQFFIWITGNFSFLNHLTVVLSTILVANVYLVPWISPPELQPASIGVSILCTILGTILVTLQIMQSYHHFFPNRTFEKWLNKVSHFHLCNRYGIFAIMTTTRYEIVIEGSDDGVEWKEYAFFHKPSEITRRPRRVSPYQPRIDWQAWFLPFGRYGEEWFGSLLIHLLKGTPDVLKLMRVNPFPEKPPQYIRSLAYEYVFSTAKEKKENGWWWRRTLVEVFTKPFRLDKSEVQPKAP